MSFLRAIDRWFHPESDPTPQEEEVAAQALKDARRQMNTVLREARALDVQLAKVEATLALQARGWMPPEDS